MRKRKLASKRNGKLGGRPKSITDAIFVIPDIKFVVITPTQYNSLLEKYGYDLLNTALQILDEWLSNGKSVSKKYLGKNNYGHFRSDGWVINSAKKLLGIDS